MQEYKRYDPQVGAKIGKMHLRSAVVGSPVYDNCKSFIEFCPRSTASDCGSEYMLQVLS